MSTSEPEAYEIGWVPFLGTKILLDSKPLIPRPETEWWVEKFASSTEDRPLRILDLFAGSGCVGVAVLKHLPQARVDFGELETRHFDTIRKNLTENSVTGNIIQTDVYSNIQGKYDFILANPPYLSESRISRIEDSVLEHEPREALIAEDDGFALIEATIRGASEHLNPHGQLWVEHEPEHTQRIATLTHELGDTVATHCDQYGVERYSVILLS